MEHSLDSYFWNNNNFNEILYDNRRICAKLYVFFRALRILNADFNFYKFLAVYILMTFYYFFYIFLYYMHK